MDETRPATKYDADETKKIIQDFVKYKLQSEGHEWTPASPLSTPDGKLQSLIRSLGDSFNESATEEFLAACTELKVDRDHLHQTLVGVAEELFDGGAKWGRVVALISFSAYLAVKCFEENMPEMVDKVVTWTAEYFNQRLAGWIDRENGWAGFQEFYDVPDADDSKKSRWPSFKNTFCLAAGAVMGAVLILKS